MSQADYLILLPRGRFVTCRQNARVQLRKAQVRLLLSVTGSLVILSRSCRSLAALLPPSCRSLAAPLPLSRRSLAALAARLRLACGFCRALAAARTSIAFGAVQHHMHTRAEGLSNQEHADKSAHACVLCSTSRSTCCT